MGECGARVVGGVHGSVENRKVVAEVKRYGNGARMLAFADRIRVMRRNRRGVKGISCIF